MATSDQPGGSRAGRPIRFAPERAYAPFVYDGADGTPRGLSIDMLRALEPSLGAPLEWLPSADLAHILGAVGKGYPVEAHLRARHPHVNWVTQPNDEAALQSLRRGEVEAWVADFALRMRCSTN